MRSAASVDTTPISTPPIMWKPGNKLGCFVKDKIFQFDEHPPRNTEPLNHLPFKSISARLLQAIKLSVAIFAWSESHRSIKYVVLMKIVKASGLVK